jgi:hypothetical protein
VNVPTQQLQRGAATSVTATLPGADGEPETGLTVTVTIETADGTDLYTDTAATDNGDGTYSKAVTASDLSSLNLLTATWKVSSVTRVVTTHEVVSGFYFSASELAAVEHGRAPELDTTAFAALRREVEAEAEDICGVAFVRRYARRTLDGTGTARLFLPDAEPKTIRSVRVYSDATTFTSFTADEIAAIDKSPSGKIERLDGSTFTAGCRNIVIEYEHGYDLPPGDLKRAALRRARTRSNSATSGVPDRATAITAENGATYRLHMPGERATGDPEVDAVYDRYSWRKHQVLVR